MHTLPIRRPKLRVADFARRDGTVRLGWDPERSFVVTPPPGVDPDILLDILHRLDGRHSRAHVIWYAGTVGLSGNAMSTLLSELAESGLLGEGRDPTAAAAPITRRKVHILGRGPLSDALAAAITPSAATVVLRTSVAPAELLSSDDQRWRCDIAVLTDDLAPDPRVVTALVHARTPHLQIRIRDGKGIVGPFVLPGESSCLRCAELARCGLDPQWPHVSAQLLGRVGVGTKPTILATAAFALAQIETFLGGRPAELQNVSVELDLTRQTMDRREWVRHPGCDCNLIPT